MILIHTTRWLAGRLFPKTTELTAGLLHYLVVAKVVVPEQIGTSQH